MVSKKCLFQSLLLCLIVSLNVIRCENSTALSDSEPGPER